jgi:hypothetical protein
VKAYMLKQVILCETFNRSLLMGLLSQAGNNLFKIFINLLLTVKKIVSFFLEAYISTLVDQDPCSGLSQIDKLIECHQHYLNDMLVHSQK